MLLTFLGLVIVFSIFNEKSKSHTKIKKILIRLTYKFYFGTFKPAVLVPKRFFSDLKRFHWNL